MIIIRILVLTMKQRRSECSRSWGAKTLIFIHPVWRS